MKISTNKSVGPGDKKVASNRHYKNEAEKMKQEKDEGKNTPFQRSLRDAEMRNKKEFHWSDKEKKSSDTPFEGSRPIATRSTYIEHKPVPSKVVPFSPPINPSLKGNPGGNITGKKTTITPKFNQGQKGSRGHSVVKNTLLRKIEKAVNPGKYGAESNSGKNININRSTKHSSGNAKPSSYNIALAGDQYKTFSVKKLKPKQIMKAAKEKGLIK